MSEHTEPHGHGDAHGHGSLRGYLIGFGLAVLLTAVPFALVMTRAFAPGTIALVITGLAIVQILVHMIFFLHMDTRSEGGWTMMAAIFTVVLVMIAFSGSVWVMYHLNANMMPTMTMQQASQMQ